MSKIIYTLLIMLIAIKSHAAWDGSVRGKISLIQVTSGANYGFRVHLGGGAKLCGNDNDWAYLLDTDSNYQTYVSLLTAAKFAKNEVTLFTNKSANGYCKIGHLYIH